MKRKNSLFLSLEFIKMIDFQRTNGVNSQMMMQMIQIKLNIDSSCCCCWWRQMQNYLVVYTKEKIALNMVYLCFLAIKVVRGCFLGKKSQMLLEHLSKHKDYFQGYQQFELKIVRHYYQDYQFMERIWLLFSMHSSSFNLPQYSSYLC